MLQIVGVRPSRLNYLARRGQCALERSTTKLAKATLPGKRWTTEDYESRPLFEKTSARGVHGTWMVPFIGRCRSPSDRVTNCSQCTVISQCDKTWIEHFQVFLCCW